MFSPSDPFAFHFPSAHTHIQTHIVRCTQVIRIAFKNISAYHKTIKVKKRNICIKRLLCVCAFLFPTQIYSMCAICVCVCVWTSQCTSVLSKQDKMYIVCKKNINNICLKCSEHVIFCQVHTTITRIFIRNFPHHSKFKWCFIKDDKIECWKCLFFNTIQCDRWEIFDKIKFMCFPSIMLFIFHRFSFLILIVALRCFLFSFLFWHKFRMSSHTRTINVQILPFSLTLCSSPFLLF